MIWDLITELKGQEMMSFKLSLKNKIKQTHHNKVNKKALQCPLPAWLASEMRTKQENIKMPPAKEAWKIRLSLSGDCSAACWRCLNRIVSQLGSIHWGLLFPPPLTNPSFPLCYPSWNYALSDQHFYSPQTWMTYVTSETKPHHYSHFELPSLFFRADLWYLPASLLECPKQFIPQHPSCKEIMPKLFTG